MTRRMRLLLDNMLATSAKEKMSSPISRKTASSERASTREDDLPVDVSIRVSQPNPKDKTGFMLTVQIEMVAGWHAYAAVPAGSGLRAVAIELDLPKGIKAGSSWKRPEGLEAPERPGVELLRGTVTFSRMLKANHPNHGTTVGVESSGSALQ